jgi:hypothetical protein
VPKKLYTKCGLFTTLIFTTYGKKRTVYAGRRLESEKHSVNVKGKVKVKR